jgi:hypothetical protein
VEEGAAGNSFFLLLEGRVCVLRGGWQVATTDELSRQNAGGQMLAS